MEGSIRIRERILQGFTGSGLKNQKSSGLLRVLLYNSVQIMSDAAPLDYSSLSSLALGGRPASSSSSSSSSTDGSGTLGGLRLRHPAALGLAPR